MKRACVLMQPCSHMCLCPGCAAMLRDPLRPFPAVKCNGPRSLVAVCTLCCRPRSVDPKPQTPNPKPRYLLLLYSSMGHGFHWLSAHCAADGHALDFTAQSLAP